jgi:pimeloyl-ACP methyl ester carboxylesterase
MATFELSPGVSMFYRDDDLTDPWTKPETMALLHGNSENGTAWNRWMPIVARHFRVIRPDMRGFGQSTPMPIDHNWTVDELADDYLRLFDSLGIDKVHLVGAKISAAASLRLAAKYPERVRSVTITGGRVISGGEGFGNALGDRLKQIEKDGVIAWARDTMRGRLGTDCPPEMLEGWIQMMGKTAKSTQLGFLPRIAGSDVSPDLPKVQAPTLVLTTVGSKNSSLDKVKAAAAKIRRSEVIVFEGDSYHVAATHPEQCAQATVDFIARNAAVPA